MAEPSPIAPARMTFRIKFHNHAKDLAHDMEFVAPGFEDALQLAAEATGGRSAELWLDDKPLGRVKSLDGEVWQVGSIEPL